MGLKKRVERRQGKVDAARASFGTDNVDGGFDRKLNRLKKSVAKSEKRGMNMDYDTTDASGEGRSRTSTRSGVSRYGSDHGDSPAELTAGGKKKIMSSDANPAFKKAIASSPINNISYGDKSGVTGYIGEERADLMKYNPVDDRAGMSRAKYGGNKGDEKRSATKDYDGMSRYGGNKGDIKRSAKKDY